jgi:hypothetical protein
LIFKELPFINRRGFRVLNVNYTGNGKILACRAFFKDFPVGGGAFFEKGPFCEIIY